MERFTTLMLDSKNIDLVKDVGQIPYNLYKNGIYESYLVSADIDVNGTNINSVDGLNVRVIPIRLRSKTLTGIFYLIGNSRDIDILNLYHCRRRTYIFSGLYKICNPKGKVYLKLDADFITARYVKENKRYRNLFHKLSKISDVVSAESGVIAELLQVYSEKKIHVIPNGTDMKAPDEFSSKRNIFLTVARIGTYEKNDEFLLEAFSRIADKCDWDLVLVGSVESAFTQYLEQFLDDHPTLKGRVVITGEIGDRNELMEYYKKAKVFVLPSRSEASSLVCAEALKMGCFMVISDQIPPQREFTANGKYGFVSGIDDVNAFAETMYKATKVDIDEELCRSISNYASKFFSWPVICDKLSKLLK